jgi:hypothetical protein
LGISVDAVWCDEAYVQARRLRFPLLANFHPKVRIPLATAGGAPSCTELLTCLDVKRDAPLLPESEGRGAPRR